MTQMKFLICTCKLINMLSVFLIVTNFFAQVAGNVIRKSVVKKSFVYNTNDDKFLKTFCHDLISENDLTVKMKGPNRTWTIPTINARPEKQLNVVENRIDFG